MRHIVVAAGALNQTPLDWGGNRSRISQAIARAREQGASLLCLPELCISGYGCEDMFLAPHVVERSWAELQSLLPLCKEILVAVGIAVRFEGTVYNCAALIHDGKILGITAKKYLCGEGVHYEPRWFTEWPVGKQVQLQIAGQSIPFGDVWYEADGVRIGIEVCHDAWVKNRHANDLVRRGVDVIINPSVSHFSLEKRAIVEKLCCAPTQDSSVSYVFANLIGCEAGRIIYGGDAIIAQKGEISASGPRFSFNEVEVTSDRVEIDDTSTRTGKLEFLDAKKLRPTVVKNFSWKTAAEVQKRKRDGWESSKEILFEEFTRAVALGLHDYKRKSGAKGYVISLSGGADSSAAACLVNYSRELANAQLQQNTKLDVVLTCVYQAAENSSDTTLNSAKSLAQELGARFISLDIAPLVDSYTKLVGSAIDHEFSWKKDDLALQNIQSRVRSPGVWMIANHLGAILITTSNRSEAAVGYATMDGDLSGGLCPLGGIDKDFLRRWLRWVEKAGPEGLKPVPSLHAVNVQAPTAELRPAEMKQTDEKDLMPYDVLACIEREAIRNKRSSSEVMTVVQRRFPEAKAEQISEWVTRFEKLWRASQWKRERLAPSFHVDDFNVDPRSWCRYPILSGER